MSRLIKSAHVVSLEDLKRLELIRRLAPPSVPEAADAFDAEAAEAASQREQLLQDAQDAAEELLRQAREAADDIARQAAEDAEAWWRQRRAEDEAHVQSAQAAGYEAGYREGAERAEADLNDRWSGALHEAATIVAQAYEAKNRIIADSEAFVVELSCSIAEKIIGKRTAKTPETAMKLFAQALSRRKEQGQITLCVSPAQFAFVHAASEELTAFIDSQAELVVVPDPSVGDGGCIVRSAFGSIDARIDTQLSAIREELLRVAAHAAEEATAHDPA